MFHAIPPQIDSRMRELEEIDAADRASGTSRMQRLRQVTAETGRFLALLAASAPPGEMIEIGTSGGYSTLWLAQACRLSGRHVTTFEILPEKAELARETFRSAGVEDVVRLVVGDARDALPDYDGIAFCFLDAEKDVYADCYEAAVPNMVSGGLLVADNCISHRDALAPMIQMVMRDDRVDALVVPIGSGELVCRVL